MKFPNILSKKPIKLSRVGLTWPFQFYVYHDKDLLEEDWLPASRNTSQKLPGRTFGENTLPFISPARLRNHQARIKRSTHRQTEHGAPDLWENPNTPTRLRIHQTRINLCCQTLNFHPHPIYEHEASDHWENPRRSHTRNLHLTLLYTKNDRTLRINRRRAGNRRTSRPPWNTALQHKKPQSPWYRRRFPKLPFPPCLLFYT